jgi:hypothetical protein
VKNFFGKFLEPCRRKLHDKSTKEKCMQKIVSEYSGTSMEKVEVSYYYLDHLVGSVNG